MKERGRPRSFDRAAALQRAMRVFWAKGFDATSMTDLTLAMGINSPSLYAAFGSKEALFEEAVRLYGESEGTEIWNALDEAPTARRAIEWFLHRSALSFSRPGVPAGCLIVLGAVHAGKGSEQACRTLRQRRSENVTDLRKRLERSVREGELRDGVNCQAIAMFYATVQHGMSIQARDGAGREALLAVADCAIAAWDALTSPAKPQQVSA
jgi:AcrR family transcriptional regulator